MNENELIGIANRILDLMDECGVRYLHDNRAVRAAVAEYCEPRAIDLSADDAYYVAEYLRDDFQSALTH